jgi:hypothetical protein
MIEPIVGLKGVAETRIEVTFLIPLRIPVMTVTPSKDDDKSRDTTLV